MCGWPQPARARERTLPAGFIAPSLPIKTAKLPSGGQWLHEIKHDGFRIIARKDGDRVKLYSRPGNDLTKRFPLIVEALARLRSRSCIIDGEAVACGERGLSELKPECVLTNSAWTIKAPELCEAFLNRRPC
jgi:ATP-dependent DNA ligase